MPEPLPLLEPPLRCAAEDTRGIEKSVQARERFEAKRQCPIRRKPKENSSWLTKSAVLPVAYSSAPSSGRSRVLSPVRRTSVRQPYLQPRRRPAPSRPAASSIVPAPPPRGVIYGPPKASTTKSPGTLQSESLDLPLALRRCPCADHRQRSRRRSPCATGACRCATSDPGSFTRAWPWSIDAD